MINFNYNENSTLNEIINMVISETLKRLEYKKTLTAKVLGIDRKTLYRRMLEANINIPKNFCERCGKTND